MFAWQFSKALQLATQHGWTRFVSMQDHYNLIYREEEREMIPLCIEEGIGVIPWSPLARGKITRLSTDAQNSYRAETDEFGKVLYKQTWESDVKVIDTVTEIAKKRDIPQAQIGLAWILGKPGVTSPIVGATKEHHLDDAAAALSVKLTSEEVAALEEHYVAHPILGHG
jgi:aryl-alcohol dehydrogenase-like predicted oxidoreductase